MRRKTAALLMFVGSVILSACTGRDTTSPRGIAPDLANYVVTTGYAATCDFTAINAAKKNAFTSNKDSAYAYTAGLQKAYNGGADASATNIVWQIGRLVAKERLTSATTTPGAVAIYLIDVLRCASDVRGTAPYPTLQLPQKFLDNATSIISSGIWEVRGASNVQFPAAGRVFDSHLSPAARNFGLPRWGVEAVTTWGGTTEYGVFGYPSTVGTLVVGSPANINTNEVEANAFELGMIPANTPVSGLRVGVCVATDPSNGVVNRVVHNDTEILDRSNLTSLCSTQIPGYVALAPTPSAWYASALSAVGRLIVPKEAFAQFTDCSTCIGGLPSDWSPFSANALLAASIQMTYTDTLPSNTTVGALANVRATAMIGSTPVPGVTFTLSITGNSGNPAGATFQNGSTTISGVTNSAGVAQFQAALMKPGGYTIGYAGSIDGFAATGTFVQTVMVKQP